MNLSDALFLNKLLQFRICVERVKKRKKWIECNVSASGNLGGHSVGCCTRNVLSRGTAVSKRPHSTDAAALR